MSVENPSRKVVYWKNSQGHWERFYLVSTHDWNSTATLENGIGKVVCRQSEMLTQQEYNALKLEEHKKDVLSTHRRLIELWGSGPDKPSKAAWRRHVSYCAEQMGKKVTGIGKSVAMLKRLGLIK